MNQVNAILKMNNDELAHGIAGTTASWHAQYKGNAWVFVGGLVEHLTEGDVLAVCSQYGEIEDFHLVRDEDSGKSQGFGFLKYEDERSTVLSVDNLNGYKLLGKTLRVDHTDYRPPKKKMKEVKAAEATGAEYVAQTSGHAYVGKELATTHSLTSGVDVFNPAVDPRPVAAAPSAATAATGANSIAVDSDRCGRATAARAESKDSHKRKREETKRNKKAQKKKAKKMVKKKKKAAKKAAKKKDKKEKKKKKKDTKDKKSESSSESEAEDEDDEDALLKKAEQFLEKKTTSTIDTSVMQRTIGRLLGVKKK